ncbi:MAG: DUF4229 domain-containing protein [Actinobacteria bacterium]|nr:DUF4229 domain-containing protein [Actinomycetota bacterium]NBY16013.1 DUF4229 domain-containing protein [Actinomycetota bacterium]
MKPTLIYTLSRLGLLSACLGLGYLASLRGPILIVVAFLGSGVLSFLLLAKQRSAMGEQLSSAVSRVSKKLEENTRKEDID